MQVITQLSDMRDYQRRLNQQGIEIGLVPTMGALHEGHLSLVRTSLAQANQTIVSLFLNSLQFDSSEDLMQYPRNEAKDLALLEEIGVDIVFMAQADELYPKGFDTYVEVSQLSEGLCGAERPRHFRGVTTVLCKLFHIVQPTWAYFGQKDFQQLRVIQKMVSDLNMNVELVVCPTIREESGLAMSSRNQRLNDEQKKHSAGIYRALCDSLQKSELGLLKKDLKEALLSIPELKINYLEVVDYHTLLPVDDLESVCIVAVAVFMDEVRLIDHVERRINDTRNAKI
jgi:pantoate--beta-alanine ligase